MAISVLFTGLAIAAVLVVVGYRMMSYEAVSRTPPDVSASLPAGARVVATAVTNERIAVTVEAGGQTEIHLFDLNTLQPRGRLRLGSGK